MTLKLSNGLELSAEQESNLRKLAHFHLRGIESSPMGFDMESFCEADDVEWCIDPHQVMNTCGAVGCLIGHGPYAGVTAREGEGWEEYSWRAFLPMGADDEWSWCFSQYWADTDNTPAGGAKRILWLLGHGLPANWEAQQMGKSPLCYADWEPELPPEIPEIVPERVAVGG